MRDTVSSLMEKIYMLDSLKKECAMAMERIKAILTMMVYG